MEPAALSVVLPVYNEGKTIAAVLWGLHQSVRARPLELLVVYDREEDDTVPVLLGLVPEIPGLLSVRNQVGRGVLPALRTGLKAARAPYVLVMMADGSDDPGTIDPMLAAARAGADVVAGSRYMPGGRQLGGPRLKGLLARTAGLSLHHLAGLPIHDATSNFRLYSRRFLERVTIESTGGFELALELTVKAHALGLRLAEVPTTWRDRRAGVSHFDLRRLLPHYLRWYWYALTARPRGLLGS